MGDSTKHISLTVEALCNDICFSVDDIYRICNIELYQTCSEETGSIPRFILVWHLVLLASESQNLAAITAVDDIFLEHTFGKVRSVLSAI